MSNQSKEDIRESIIGLGERSIRKSYYPQLKKKIEEIEELNKTLEKKVEERTKKLLEQKNIFETLFYDTSDGLSLIKDGKFIDCNNSVLKMLKYNSKEEFLNLKPHELSPQYQPDGEKSEDKAKKLIQICLKEGHHRFEWVHTKSTKEEFWVEVVLTKILLNNEDLIHVVWRDIGEKKCLQEQILRRNEELEDSNNELEISLNNLKQTQNKLIESEKMASLGGLVAGVAHEINTPVGIGLTGITHFLNISEELEKKYNSDTMTQEDFEEYLKTAKQVATMINSNLMKTAELVKSFKQISVDQTSEEKREFKIKDYLEEILLSLNSILKKQKCTIKIDCDETLIINSYPGAFSQIVTNLIINSINHAFENKESELINIDITKENDSIKLIYKDNGKGIKQTYLEKIFDPFFTTSRDKGGTGLGLNIIYNIVTNKLNGSITCKSEENLGVEFNINFKL